MTRIYRYILETDGGMAPCSQDGLVTLATCKPTIRRVASEGDWVAGFIPGSNHRGELVWAGRIAEKLSHDKYHTRNPRRRDAIYKLDSSGTYRKSLDGYHCDPVQQKRDHDNPVLLFAEGESWYLGSDPLQLPESLMHLAPAGQGHRVNFRRDGDLVKWEAWLHLHPVHVNGTPGDEVILCKGCQWCSEKDGLAPSCGRRRPPSSRPRKSKPC